MEVRRVPCVGGIVRDDRGSLLLVRRGTDPGKGRWSIPGGRVEPGESAEEAVVRELAEETGLRVEPGPSLGRVERGGPPGVLYEIDDLACALAPGEQPGHARAGDDADEVGWFTDEQLVGLDCVDGLLDALRDWRVIPWRGGPPGS